MGRVGLAFKVFFRTLGDRSLAEQIGRLLQGERLPAIEEPRTAVQTPSKPPEKKAPTRSDAINLLAALQRDARFVDFIKEPLAGYSDAQIGAAARDVHRDSGAVLERVFGLQSLLTDSEGSQVEISAAETAKFKLTGNVSGQPPYRGRLAHHGWAATRCDLPVWTGSDASALIVAPAEVELT